MEPDPILRQWGENIRLSREVLGLTQTELAEKLDPPVTQPTVTRWERGQVEPRRHYKVQLARILRSDVRMMFPMVVAS